MPPEVRDRAFEPFFSTKEQGKGSGLGLSMVFGFIKQTGGHISIYSEPGAGTTLRLYLPPATGEIRREQDDALKKSLPRGSEHILVVEDDPDVREMAVSSLEFLGYQVGQAADGPQGVAQVESGDFDLVLCDVLLPGGLTANDMADKIAAARPGTPVLFMSGYTANTIVENGKIHPDIAFMPKPFTRNVLAQRVRDLLDRVPDAQG